jgi:large subunit ribosomal protein L15
MPLQKRLPKFGFSSRISRVSAQIRLAELNGVDAEVIDLEALRAAGLVNSTIRRAKVFLSGELTKPVKIQGLAITAGARAALEAAGGQIVEQDKV